MKIFFKSLPYVVSAIWLLAAVGIAVNSQPDDSNLLTIGIQVLIYGVLPILALAGIRWVAREISAEGRAARSIEGNINQYMKFLAGVALLTGCGIVALLVATPFLSSSVSAQCTYVEGGIDCGQLAVSNSSPSTVELELTGKFSFNGATPKGKWQLDGSSNSVFSLRPGIYRAVVRCGLAWDELEDVTVGVNSKMTIIGNC